jgi:transposase
MANKLLSMHKVRQILLFLKQGASQRSIEKDVKINRRTIAVYLQKFMESGKQFEELLKLSDQQLEEFLCLLKPIPVDSDPRKIELKALIPGYMAEMAANSNITRLLLWEEYIKKYPHGFKYSRFCDFFTDHAKVNNAVMHFEHDPAKMLQVDFAGDKLHYIERSTGEMIECPVFIGVLPFSSFDYVEALHDATLPQVLKALNNLLDYLGGVPLSVKSDNMRQWVSKSCKYEPTFPEMLEQWAGHNHIALLAARPYRPRDKPSVENGVVIAYRRIYAQLRNETFYSLAELNKAIREKLALHHLVNFQKKTFNRLELFNAKEKPLLQSLPASVYYIRHYTKAKVQKNYHVVVGEDWHFYSVPYRFIGKDVRIIYCADHVEVYCGTLRIALHTRNFASHGYTTDKEHMPENHRAILTHKGWDVDYYLQQATDNGPATLEFFKKVMENKLIVDQSYASCTGLLRLMKQYDGARMENACKRALKGYRFSYKTIKDILAKNMDKLEEDETAEFRIPKHGNLRGPETYNIN